MRPSYLEVDLSAVSHNIKQIKNHLKEETQIMPVVKANAYGLGVLALKEILEDNQVPAVAVAVVEEAIFLRQHDFRMPIMVLNELLEEECDTVVEYDLVPGISVDSVAQKLSDCASKRRKNIRVQVEVDTGMGRVGLQPQDTVAFIQRVRKLPNIQIEGIYTHFSSADTNREYTNQQIEKWNHVLEELKQIGIHLKYVHSSASSGILNFSNASYNLVRPGIILYGYLPDESLKGILDLKPSTKLKSTVAFLKTVEQGKSISYGRTYITSRRTKIATIPMGYADGLRRMLSNCWKVKIRGKLAPIIGSICMDNFMIDVTEIPDVMIGDEVLIWDNEELTIEKMAKQCHTINYEILSTISGRVPRKYVSFAN